MKIPSDFQHVILSKESYTKPEKNNYFSDNQKLFDYPRSEDLGLTCIHVLNKSGSTRFSPNYCIATYGAYLGNLAIQP